MMKSWALALATGGAFATAPLAAATITLNNTGGVDVGSPVYNGFMAAAKFWSSALANNVTINLDVGYKPLATGILGQAGSNTTQVSVVAAEAALRAAATSSLDMQAISRLPSLTSAGGLTVLDNAQVRNARTGAYTTTKLLDVDNSSNNTYLDITTANAKALGFSGFSGADASITFSSNFAFDFDPRNGVGANSYDFIGVATHEIGHALGFVSGTDVYDLYTGKGPYASQRLNLNPYAIGSTLDLFRYNTASSATAVAAGTAPVLDWATGGSAFLSVDGGRTALNTGTGAALLSTGRYNGNGQQASHWIDNRYGALSKGCQAPTATIGILDPTAGKCESLAVSSLDLAALDIIGWTLGSSATGSSLRFTTSQIANLAPGSTTGVAVPEPASWMMLILGFGGIGMMMRRRQTLAIA